ncbi:MAG: ABC transporter ATP-binding protein [Lentisphaerae bacterium]|nr:MAG: ABC transporter ATP-binding protein [Lentisphaerota bacterium]
MEKDLALEVNNLSKQYHLGGYGGHDMLREAIMSRVRRLLGKETAGQSSAQNTFWALEDLSFQVKQGEVLGVIGPNGAGKSTLLKILSRITEPTRGNVRIRGRVASLLEVGTGFHPELTGYENIFLNGAILGMTRREIRAKLNDIVAFSGLERFLDTPVKRYSSGMYVRLAFAVAAHLEPEILLLDEVLAVGDVAFQKKCLGKMEDVAHSGRTVLLVSHNMSAIRSLCGRTLVLSHGKLIFDGETDEAVQHYMNLLSERQESGEWLNDDKHVGHRIRCTRIPNHIFSGADLELEFDVELTEPKENLTASVFLAKGGIPVMGASSLYQQCLGEGDGTRWRVCCTLPGLPLCPGMYSLSIWLGDSRNHFCQFSNIAQLSVSTGDVFGTGLPIPEKWGAFYWRGEWKIKAQ